MTYKKEEKMKLGIDMGGMSIKMGLVNEESTVNNPDGSVRINRTTKVTGKGQQYFINKFLR